MGWRLNYHFYSESKDEKYKAEIFNELLPKMRACSEKPGYAAGRQAFDLYYNYKDLASQEEIYELFKLAIDEGGKKTEAFVLNPIHQSFIRSALGWPGFIGRGTSICF